MSCAHPLVTPLPSLGVASALGAVVALHSPHLAAELYTRPVLPTEGEPFEVVCRTDAGLQEGEVGFRVVGADGEVLAERAAPLEEDDGAPQAALELTVPRNGLLHAEVTVGGQALELDIPVISAKREVNLIYYSMDEALLESGHVRWVTVVTTCDPGTAAVLNRRGIKPLQWHWGSNYLGEKAKQLTAEGLRMAPELARQVARQLYTTRAPQAVAEGYAGFGMDEFGGYAASEFAAQTKEFVRGIIDIRDELPEEFTLLAWHGGPIDSELMGLYKQAVEFLCLEAYLLNIVPSQLGTELLEKDLAGRLADARSNDMFTAPYGTRCRVIPAVDVTDEIPVGEYEPLFRMLRREFPEVRGVGFFNVLSEEKRPDYRIIDQLCYDYFIAPVLTFQPDSLRHDRFGTGKIVAGVSNIGAMDSGPVQVRLLANDREVARATAATVPAGYSRVDNRAAVAFDWEPEKSGTYRLRAEITDPGEATVLDPAADVSLFLRQ